MKQVFLKFDDIVLNDVVHHLPGVGQNLQEHPGALMDFETSIPTLHHRPCVMIGEKSADLILNG